MENQQGYEMSLIIILS